MCLGDFFRLKKRKILLTMILLISGVAFGLLFPAEWLKFIYLPLFIRAALIEKTSSAAIISISFAITVLWLYLLSCIVFFAINKIRPKKAIRPVPYAKLKPLGAASAVVKKKPKKISKPKKAKPKKKIRKVNPKVKKKIRPNKRKTIKKKVIKKRPKTNKIKKRKNVTKKKKPKKTKKKK